jgi:hypothetical protein
MNVITSSKECFDSADCGQQILVERGWGCDCIGRVDAARSAVQATGHQPVLTRLHVHAHDSMSSLPSRGSMCIKDRHTAAARVCSSRVQSA